MVTTASLQAGKRREGCRLVVRPAGVFREREDDGSWMEERQGN
jgi:hypothetical protein